MTPKKQIPRQVRARARALAVTAVLLAGLDATTSYHEPVTPRTPRYRGQTTFYGWQLALQAKKGAVLDADGKPTQFELVKQFSAQPGEIITSKGNKRTGAPLTQYMVQPDHSLRRI